MNPRLTVTIDRSVIESAKAYAKEQGRSLVDLIGNYLKVINREQQYSEDRQELFFRGKGAD